MDRFWTPDAIMEVAFLGIDALLLGFAYRSYRRFKDTAEALKVVEVIEPGVNLLQKKENWGLPYAVVKGVVMAIGNSLSSEMDPNLRGVMRRTILKEHKLTRRPNGFWGPEEVILNISDSTVPFMLDGKGAGVEVIEPTAAELLELMITGNSYHPMETNLCEDMTGAVTGEHIKGVQKLEQMLVEGCPMTAVGELKFSRDGLQLTPPQNLLYLLSPLPLNRIQEKISHKLFQKKLLLFSLGSVGVYVVTLLWRRYWKLRKEEEERIEESARLQRVALERRRRSRQVNHGSLSSAETCNVCLVNPKEVVLLNCGHVCICVDCYLAMPRRVCPMCRAEIVDVRAAFVA